MTHPIASTSGRSTPGNSPSGGSLSELWSRLAAAPLAPRNGGTVRAVTPRISTSAPATAAGGASGGNQSVDQVKASAVAFVDKCWSNYVRLFPEAFSTRANPATAKAPTLIFVRTQAEFDKIYGTSNDTSDMLAFVDFDNPTKVYVNTANLVKYTNKFGPDYAKATVSHELIHCLTHSVGKRIVNDLAGKTTSYREVQEDLKSTFVFDRSKSPGIKGSFSIAVLIEEFAAEHYSTMATGIGSFSVAYSPVRATGEKLLQMVGESTFRKAVLANDPAAYRRVIEAAKVLQGQNAKARRLRDMAEITTKMRAAQAAAPLGGPLTAALLEKLETRYLRESILYSTLMKECPDQLKNFDFRLLNAVDANFKSRGKVYDPDLSDASYRELAAAIKAVWPSLK